MVRRERRHSSAGANPARQLSLQPVAVGADDGGNDIFKRWDTVFPNASCAVALIDRLTHHAEILAIEGRSYRRREAELTRQQRSRKRPSRKRAADNGGQQWAQSMAVQK